MSTVSFHDQLSIETPDHVSLRLPVAGLGSRFLALLVDTVIQVAAYLLFIFAIVLLFSGVHTASAQPASSQFRAWTMAILIFLHFLLYWGYFTLFEGFWHGKTPGKHLFKLRVIRDSGRHVTLFESAARNLLRIVDALPAFYLVGILCVIFNARRKRLGDMVAGTLVVHQEETGVSGSAEITRTFTAGFYEAETALTPSPAPGSVFPADAIARLSADDLVLLDRFFVRIPDLDVNTKDQLAQRLLSTFCAKMDVHLPPSESPRPLLESIAYELRNQSSCRQTSPNR
jgi:uncharacterized RDD family membrane protein YckC